MKCTKAIIPTAGYGVRRLPITKAVDKNMLPVGNRPVIDYVVEDCIRAGVTDIIFVVSEQFDQIQSFYGRNLIMEEFLKAHGRLDELEGVINLAKQARFHYVVQDQHQPHGTAVPLWLCRNLIESGEQFLYVSADQFYYFKDGEGCEARHIINEARRLRVEMAMKAVEVPHDEVYKYGIVQMRDRKDGAKLLVSIVEKPEVNNAPSNLNNATFFLLSDKIFPALDEYMRSKPNSEYYVTDVLTNYARDGNEVAVIKVQGEYLDCGFVEGWLHANQVVIKG